MLVPTPTAEPAVPQPAIGIAPVPAMPSATKPTPASALEIPPVPSQAAMPARIDRRHAEPEIPATPKAAYAMKSPDVPGQGAAPKRLAAASQASAIRQDSPQTANALFLPPRPEERVQWQTETLSFAPVSAVSSAGHGTSQALSPGFFHHPGLPQHVMRQLSSAFRSGAEKSAELLLNPAELGRVRISLVTAETGITVNIVADRPETLELLRRHSDQLAQEFLDIGFETTAFAFGHNTGGGDQARTHGRNPEAQASGPTRSEAAGDAIPGSQAAVDSIIDLDRVDIRL
jgi:flagellar hook-length control protein FliK